MIPSGWGCSRGAELSRFVLGAGLPRILRSKVAMHISRGSQIEWKLQNSCVIMIPGIVAEFLLYLVVCVAASKPSYARPAHQLSEAIEDWIERRDASRILADWQSSRSQSG